MKIALIISAILANTLPRWLLHSSNLCDDEALQVGQLFTTWQAFSFVLVFIAAQFPTVKNEKHWWTYAMLLAINNWIDEARHHAEQIDPIEILFATSATIWLIYVLNKPLINAFVLNTLNKIRNKK